MWQFVNSFINKQSLSITIITTCVSSWSHLWIQSSWNWRNSTTKSTRASGKLSKSSTSKCWRLTTWSLSRPKRSVTLRLLLHLSVCDGEGDYDGDGAFTVFLSLCRRGVRSVTSLKDRWRILTTALCCVWTVRRITLRRTRYLVCNASLNIWLLILLLIDQRETKLIGVFLSRMQPPEFSSSPSRSLETEKVSTTLCTRPRVGRANIHRNQ